MSRWRQWRELPGPDQWLLTRAAVMLMRARLEARFIEFRPAACEPKRPEASSPPAPDLDRARAVARLVGIAAAHAPVACTCLHRALATWRLLRRIGIACDLRVGACAGSDPFAAHAWVECAGVALDADSASLARYRPFAEAIVPVRLRYALSPPVRDAA